MCAVPRARPTQPPSREGSSPSGRLPPIRTRRRNPVPVRRPAQSSFIRRLPRWLREVKPQSQQVVPGLAAGNAAREGVVPQHPVRSAPLKRSVRNPGLATVRGRQELRRSDPTQQPFTVRGGRGRYTDERVVEIGEPASPDEHFKVKSFSLQKPCNERKRNDQH